MRRLVGWSEVVVETLDLLRVAVREARRRDGLSLREVAKKAGVPFNSISRFERGGDILLSNAVALMGWLSSDGPVSGASEDGEN